MQVSELENSMVSETEKSGRFQTWFKGMRSQMDALLDQLGLSVFTGHKEIPLLSKGGAFDIGTSQFRKACAILEDGTVYLVKAYNTADVATELAHLRLKYDLPPEKERLAASLGRVAGCYDFSTDAKIAHSATHGQQRFRQVLNEAAALGASDIKLIVHADYAILRIKVGAGEFNHGEQWQANDARAAINWIYSHRDGGDGKATLIKGEPASFSIGQAGRLPGMPDGIGALRGQLAWHGDITMFITLRLLPQPDTSNMGDLVGLGLEEDILEMLMNDRKTNTGLGIIGGSTGDGKSTTLQRHMDRLYMERDGAVSIYTIEDPIEYPATGDGIVQFPVKPGQTPEERRANFSQMLMVFVRTNPDVGMVSEIRSANDVNEVLQFVTSGHKVYTTVHANSAAGILFRLIALGVRPAELSGPDVVNFVMRQKLVPVLCRHCAEPLSGPSYRQVVNWLCKDNLFITQTEHKSALTNFCSGESHLKTMDELVLFRRHNEGCSHCLAPYAKFSGSVAQTAREAWAGYAGRQATAEFILLDETYRKYVADHDQIKAQNYWLTSVKDGGMGGIPIKTRLRHLVAKGITDYERMTNEVLPDSVPASTELKEVFA